MHLSMHTPLSPCTPHAILLLLTQPRPRPSPNTLRHNLSRTQNTERNARVEADSRVESLQSEHTRDLNHIVELRADLGARREGFEHGQARAQAAEDDAAEVRAPRWALPLLLAPSCATPPSPTKPKVKF